MVGRLTAGDAGSISTDGDPKAGAMPVANAGSEGWRLTTRYAYCRFQNMRMRLYHPKYGIIVQQN